MLSKGVLGAIGTVLDNIGLSLLQVGAWQTVSGHTCNLLL